MIIDAYNLPNDVTFNSRKQLNYTMCVYLDGCDGCGSGFLLKELGFGSGESYL